ncbi:16S rRNA (guanine1207-N2)-methyltransferase [Paenibacillus shirakamiensis]|uniref:16S rRNA (Guanine1207-N2)-methyltransferase n=1 Tax=Paenibacillus shirakamiensis TaxID=1265935 RepID=A0ABS4JLN4_9BACL|nr:class I SAM-dependent methyltransferase [Paenibacillus shirakamiensis]MBP2002624.1 16S rRNA (guanine1207-N2)-methyltransferase [Paenibacillus shirakamiensis]
MPDHYYTTKPDAAHDRKLWDVVLRGKKLRFISDAGVFSKSGIDFGSKVLIEAMEIDEIDKVLDVGCGYGPIGLSAALLAPKGQVVMVDVNERAVHLAAENAASNGIHNVQIIQSDLFEKLDGQQFDVILTNPPIRAGKQTVHAIFEGAAERLKTKGSLWVVIQKKQGAPSALEKLETIFNEVDIITKEKGYWIIKAIK